MEKQYNKMITKIIQIKIENLSLKKELFLEIRYNLLQKLIKNNFFISQL